MENFISKFISKKELEIILSKLKKFEDEDVKSNIFLEQYSTNDVVASELAWFIFMNDKMNDKNNMINNADFGFIDLGSGTGILGISLLFYGFKIIFIEKDVNAVNVLKQNLNYIITEYDEYFKSINFDVKNNFVIINKDINDLDESFFVNYKNFYVIMNPPFGAVKKNKHADKNFLEKAFNFNKVYSIHNFESEKTLNFLKSISSDFNFSFKILFEKDFIIKKQHFFHKKNKKTIKVIVVLFEKNK